MDEAKALLAGLKIVIDIYTQMKRLLKIGGKKK